MQNDGTVAVIEGPVEPAVRWCLRIAPASGASLKGFSVLALAGSSRTYQRSSLVGRRTTAPLPGQPKVIQSLTVHDDTARSLPVKLATGPVTWGVDFADTPSNPPWEQVLDDIEASGVGALELGPVGYLPEDPATLARPLLSRRHLTVGRLVHLRRPARPGRARAGARHRRAGQPR